MLLVVAAVLKAYGFAVNAVSPLGVFSARWFQIGLIEFEAILGAWLIWGKYPIGSWLLGCLAFTGFAAVSLRLALVGQASCGCLGRVVLHPWYAFALDLVVLAALTVGHPTLDPAAWRQNPRFWRRWGASATIVVALAACVTLGLIGIAHIAFGSTDAALARMRGERLSVHPALIDLGNGRVGEIRTTTVQVTNWTDHEVSIFGGTSDCSCTVLGGLPLQIPPGESRACTVQLRFPKGTGIFTRKLQLIADDKGFRVVGFRLTGRAVDE